MELPPGFVRPDFSAPLDVDAYLSTVPARATVKGMFFQDIVDALRDVGKERAGVRYHAFHDYSLRDFMVFLVDAARELHPDVPTREGLRRIGQKAYPVFADTRLGKVVFGVLGSNLAVIMKMAAKGYALSLNVGRAETLDSGNSHTRIHLKEIYCFIDSYQVGVFEGAILAAKRTPDVSMRLISNSEAELLAQWS